MFKKAINLRPDYDDAMAYMNLMYREKADVECDGRVPREQDLKTANEWVDKTIAAKKAKVEEALGLRHPIPNKNICFVRRLRIAV
jgi:hypothetical protein